MADARDFSVVLFLVLVGIASYLATVRAIGGAALGWCIVASAAAVMLIRNADRLEQLIFRRGDDQILVQIRQAQQEVYAKIEELQRIADAVARFTVASMVAENPTAVKDRQAEMLRRREELEVFLRDAGIPEGRRSELLLPILYAVADQHRALIRTFAYAPIVMGHPQEVMAQRLAILKEILEPLDAIDQRAGLEEILRRAERHKLPPGSTVHGAIERYMQFLEGYPQARIRPR